MIAPDNLESRISYDKLIKHLNLELIDGYVKSCKCPLCHAGVMRIYRDFETKGWRWSCINCNWSGTSIQLYQEIKQITDIKLAWYKLAKEVLHSTEGGKLTNNDVQELLEGYYPLHDKLQLFSKFWANSHVRFNINLPTTAVEILESLGLWAENSAKLDSSIGRFIGSPSKQTLSTITQYVKFSNSKGFAYSNSIMLPYETTPGQITGLLFCDVRKQVAYKSCKLGFTDGGLLGLTEASKTSGTLFAVVDPFIFLELEKRWYGDNKKSMPLVCATTSNRGYTTPLTGFAWQAVHHDKVVLWDYVKNVDIINYARQLGTRGYIALKPQKNNFDCQEDLKHMVVTSFLKGLEASAVPWYTALKIWLLELTAVQRRNMISGISPSLNQEEIALIKADCKPSEWLKLAGAFMAQQTINLFTYDGENFIEKEGEGIYLLTKSESMEHKESLITDAYIRFSEVAQVDDKLLYKGCIYFYDKQIHFVEAEDVLRNNCASWLTDKCAEAGAIPQILKKYRNELFEIAIAQNKPKVVKALEHVGWDDKQKLWVFPRFTMDISGHIDTQTTINDSILKVPFINLKRELEYPTASQIELWTKQPEVSSLVLGLIVMIATNMISSKYFKNKYGFAIFNSNETFEATLDYVGNLYSLVAFTGDDQASVKRLAAVEQQHAVPCIIRNDRFESKPIFKWLTHTSPHNCIIKVNDKLACNLVMSGDWRFFDAQVDEYMACDFETRFDGIHELLINLLVDIDDFSKRAKLENHDPVILVIDRLEEHLDKANIKYNSRTIRNLRKRFIHTPVAQWEKHLWSVFYCVREGKLEIELDSKKPLCRDDKHYYINWNKISKKIKSLGLIEQDPVLIEQSIKGDPAIRVTTEGWVIPTDVWDKAFNNWIKLFYQFASLSSTD